MVFATRGGIGLFCLVGYINKVLGDVGKELFEVAVKRGGQPSEALKRSQGGREKHVLPHFTIATGGVVNIKTTNLGRESVES